jgi:hypoxanthine phosphoribosyltransferase
LAEQHTDATGAAPEEPTKPARRRRAPARKAAAPATAADIAPAQDAAPPEDEAKPATRRRRSAARKADAPAVEAAAETADAEAKPAPRRRRSTAKKAEDAPAAEATAEPMAEAEAKPATRRRRSAAKKAEDAPTAEATAEPVAEAEAKPATRRRRSSAKKAEDAPTAEARAEPVADAEAKPTTRRRRSAAKKAEDAPTAEATAEPAADAEAKPATRRRRRSTAKQTEDAPAAEATAEPVADAPPAEEAVTADGEQATGTGRRRRRGHRGGARRRKAKAAEGPVFPPGAEALHTEEHNIFLPAGESLHGGRTQGKKENIPAPDTTIDVSFMHPSEIEFAALLDYYHINYLYEPRSFPLRWDGERVVEMFTPDFYLPEYDQYFELTTMKQSLVTQKNRKLRHVREMYPEVNVQLLYRRDLMRLMGKYGFGPLSQVSVEGTEQRLFSEEQVRVRVGELGRQLARDYADKDPVVIGVLRGVVVFMADLVRQMDIPLQMEFMEISHYGEERTRTIDVLRDVGTDIKDRHVIVVEDIVDTGLTLRYLLEYLQNRGPASLKVCTLLDKRARRVANIDLDYVGFEVGDEFVIGYGLDYGGRYRNLPYIGVLKPQEPKAVAQR